jgi:hypothetical protein
MQARLIAKAKEVRDDGSIVEIGIWQVPTPVLPCRHSYKYRLYYFTVVLLGCAVFATITAIPNSKVIQPETAGLLPIPTRK